VIDCEFAGKGFELNTVRLCVFVGLTIRNGNSMQGTFPRTAGGAVYSFDSDPTFIDCVFADCYAPHTGGGVYSQYDGPTFERCVFAGNETGYETSGYGGGGFGVRWVLGECVFKSCIFRDNRTGRSGGAAYLRPVHGRVVIDSTLFIDNGCEKWGGALYFSDGTADVANCTFVRNSAGEQGSAIHGSYAPDLLQRCILSFGLGGGVASGSGAFEQCCLFANAGGDTLPGGTPGYIVGDPRFCDLPLRDVTLDASSPCLPSNNDWGVLIGAFPNGCGQVAVEEVSWGHIKSLYR
jgi:predicted outer membrane repeat protein